MTCYNPQYAMISSHIDNKTGEYKRKVKLLRSTFPAEKRYNIYVETQALPQQYRDLSDCIPLPCGRCLGCQLKRASDWSLRCMHEAKYYEKSSFLTLTYDSEHLPFMLDDGSIVRGRQNAPSGALPTLYKKDFQDFMKRLRITLKRKYNITDIRFFMGAEYGDLKGRPHYHVILFGYDFPDRKTTANNAHAQDVLYDSAELDRIWGNGITKVGIRVGSEAASYVARYCVKKSYGQEKVEKYDKTNRIPMYNSSSQGLGKRFLNEYIDAISNRDYVRDDKMRKRALPRYYDKLIERWDYQRYCAMKLKRKEKYAIVPIGEQHPQKLADRQEVLRRKVAQYVRVL